ncbi:HutD family protein [Streptococcus catagoni]|uniref:HutD family protein n=1 Tax=Streptococcus catagoni TaxID=2654874 RepID=UPI00140DFA57|nr:HutD family protein [Streptococcus catagoni]
MIDIKIVTDNDFKESLWSGGKTRELLIFPRSSSYKEKNFDYRLSTASVEEPTTVFSDVSSYHRLIMTLDHSISLKNADKKEVKILQPFESYYFEGHEKVFSVGECKDFNLMYNNKYDGQIMAIASNNDPICGNNPIQIIYALNDLNYQIEGKDSGFLQANNLLIVKQNTQAAKIRIHLSPIHDGKKSMLAVWTGLSYRNGLSLHDL